MFLKTICNEKGNWLGKVYEDAYDMKYLYLCKLDENIVFLLDANDFQGNTPGLYFLSEQEVVDAFIQYNKAKDARQELEKELLAKSNRYVWDNGELRKV